MSDDEFQILILIHTDIRDCQNERFMIVK